MSFLSLDDGFCEHPKITRLSHQAFRVHVTGLVYCARNLTDGHISSSAVKIVLASAGLRTRRYIIELVDGDLWKTDRLGDGYWVHDYLEHNLPSSEIKVRREKRAKAGRAGGTVSGRKRRNKAKTAEANAKANRSRSVEPPPLPSHPHSFSYEPSLHYEGTNLTIRGAGGQHPDRQPFDQLHRAVGGSQEALTKLRRAWANPPDAACIIALEACTGLGVRDRLAVALAELKKQRLAAR